MTRHFFTATGDNLGIIIENPRHPYDTHIAYDEIEDLLDIITDLYNEDQYIEKTCQKTTLNGEIAIYEDTKNNLIRKITIGNLQLKTYYSYGQKKISLELEDHQRKDQQTALHFLENHKKIKNKAEQLSQQELTIPQARKTLYQLAKHLQKNAQNLNTTATIQYLLDHIHI